MKLYKFLVIPLTLAGCASLTHGKNQRVLISTPGASHAECTVTSQSLGVQKVITPEALNVPRSSEQITVSCHKQCYVNATKVIAPDLNTEDLASNGFFGIATVAIDAATKRAYNYTYDFVVPMKLKPGCNRSSKGFLDGNPKDFNNQIHDFSFDDKPPPPLPEETPMDLKLPEPAPLADKNK